MKSRLILALTALLILAAVVACQPAALPTAVPPTSAPAAAPTTAAPPAAKAFRVAVVMPSAVNDLAFSQSMFEALKSVQKDMGGKDKFDFVYSDNVFVVGDAAAALRDYATKGFDLVIAHGSQYGASLAEIAPDFPKTAFAWGTAVDTYESKGIKNIYSYTVQSDQGGYVEGVMAAMLTKSNTIGVIGPIEAGDAKLTIDGFKAAVAATKPAAKVQVVYTGSFSDVALASTAAQTQINSGADVLTGSAQMVVGAISVAKDKNVLWFGNQASQTSLAPKVVVANQIYDWTPMLKEMIANVGKGKLGTQVFTTNFKNAGIRMEFNPDFQLPADVKAAADKTIKGLTDGTLQTGIK